MFQRRLPHSASPVETLIRRHRLRPIELLPWIIAVGAYFGFADYLALGSQILIMILFALSLDLVLGYAGIVTLGHSAFFGVGAYAAGIYAAHVSGEPISGLLVAGVTAAAVGWASGLVVLRTQGLTLLMLTLAVTALLAEAANKASFITGGADGLQGVDIDPVLGIFRFDLFGHTAYLYCLLMLFAFWWVVRRLVYSPFGAALTGIRENTPRMHAIGAPVYRRLLIAYTLAATIAGVAGALLTQTNQFVGLNVLGFEPSGELVVMLVLGGVGRLYGAFVGPLAYLIAQDVLAKQFPQYWYLGIGLILVLVVLFARGGLLGIADAVAARRRRRGMA